MRRATERFKPYTRVLLQELVKNFELNGQCGVIVPQNCSVSSEVFGCFKIRLESGREVAVKPSNLQLVVAAAPEGSGPATSQEQRLQEVLAQIKTESAAVAPARG